MVRTVDHDFDDIHRRLSEGETMTSIAESKGVTQGNLSNWLRGQLKKRGLTKEVSTQFIPLDE